jgi:hypothetical protein
MQRWQRRAHLWLWLVLAAIVALTAARLIEDQPQLGQLSSEP